MPYRLKVSEGELFGKSKFVNSKGNTECVELVKQAAGAPQTALWKKGIHVMSSGFGAIPRGTAIATFDESGKYSIDGLGKHAAIYLGHTIDGIRVLDQWNKQEEVKERTIYFHKPDYPRINSAKQYFVIE